MTPFSIENLPYGVISTAKDHRKRCAVAFGDSAIDLEQLSRDGFFASVADLPNNVFAGVSVALKANHIGCTLILTLPCIGHLECLRRSACGPPCFGPGAPPARHPVFCRRPRQDPAVSSAEPPPHGHAQLFRLLLLPRACPQRWFLFLVCFRVRIITALTDFSSAPRSWEAIALPLIGLASHPSTTAAPPAWPSQGRQ